MCHVEVTQSLKTNGMEVLCGGLDWCIMIHVIGKRFN